MKLFYIILLTILYIINSKVYLMIYDKILYKKYNKNSTYNILWLTLAFITTLKQFSKLLLNNVSLLSAISVLMLLFHIFVVIYFFKGTTKAKIIAIGIPFASCVLIDVLVLEICSFILKMQVSELSELGLANVVASGLSSSISLLAYFLYFQVLSRKEEQMLYEYNDVYILSIINLIIVVPSIIIFNNISVIKDNLSIIVIGQFGIIAFISILCSIMISRKNITVFEIKARELEKELGYYNSISESFEQLRKLRHDMSNHIDLLYMLLKNNEVEESMKYIEELSDSITDSKDICIFDKTFPDDKLISIILSEKIKRARAKGITMKRSIFITPYFHQVMEQMKDHEKTALFSNLLDNAIEAAEQSKEKKIKLEIRSDGMCNKKNEICCILLIRVQNSFSQNKLESNGKGNLKTTKKDKALHGLGMGIIDEIVRKYGGSIEKGVNLSERFKKYAHEQLGSPDTYKEPASPYFETQIVFESGVMDEEYMAIYRSSFGLL